MTAQTASERVETEERRRSLVRLYRELLQVGVRATIRKGRNGRWRLKLRGRGWSETVLCAGAEGVYAFVTAHGRLLGSVEDTRHIARVLAWMIEGKRR